MTKQRILSIILITGLVFLLNIVLGKSYYSQKLPYHWGSDEISDKAYFLRNSPGSFNAVFLGSSKTHNQVVVKLFDSLARANGADIRSYNFGIGGLTPLESLHIYENLIRSDSVKLKHAFVELDWIATIKLENLNATRSFYWLDGKNYSTSINSITNSSVPFYRQGWGLFHYTWDHLQNVLNIGLVNEQVKVGKHAASQLISLADSNTVNNGFIPITHNMNTTEYPLFHEVISSAQWAVNNKEMLEQQKLSKPFLSRLEEIQELSKSRGIRLFFVVPLQWKQYQYRELLPVIKALGPENVLSMYDIYHYSQLYKLEHFADPNHLNLTGARIYTDELYKQFSTRLNYERAN